MSEFKEGRRSHYILEKAWRTVLFTCDLLFSMWFIYWKLTHCEFFWLKKFSWFTIVKRTQMNLFTLLRKTILFLKSVILYKNMYFWMTSENTYGNTELMVILRTIIGLNPELSVGLEECIFHPFCLIINLSHLLNSLFSQNLN